MWYRIEFNRDGSIKESNPVEGRGTDGGHVCYVDAENSPDAIRLAAQWRRQYLERAKLHRRAQRSEAAKSGICQSCLRRQAEGGTVRCAKCKADRSRPKVRARKESGAGKGGGGRFSASDGELELLLEVEHQHSALSAAKFREWLGEQIAFRRTKSRRFREAA